MSNTIAELSIVQSFHQGKVRDIYDLGDKLLLVTSDRVSAFDVVFPNVIPGKGKILNQISVFFFKQTKHIVENHLITDQVEEYPVDLLPFAEDLRHRSMLVKKSRVIPFECIVRGYLSGSAWAEYKNTATIGGVLVTESMRESQRFPAPLFTPSTKAESGHDMNISFKKMCDRMDLNIAEFIKEKSIKLFEYVHSQMLPKDIILADTKFEFGTIDGRIFLIDEIFTPDSSRFWDKNDYEIGTSPKSYDKQFIRDYVSNSGWNKQPPAPELSKEVIEKTLEKYQTIYKKIVGSEAIL